MTSKLSRWSDAFLEASWLAAVIIVPLFFNIHSSRVFEPDKLTLLRSIALLMAAVWLVGFIDRQGWRAFSRPGKGDGRPFWRIPFALPVLLLVIVYIVSSILSVTPAISWLGSYQRLQGTYTTFSYIVVFAVMASTIRSRAQIERIVTAVIITSIPIALYALLQRAGHDPLPWGGDVQRRVAGHMGNAIFIAAYLIMVVPLTLGRIIDAFTNILADEEVSQADILRSSIYIFALLIQGTAIIYTFSRGPWLGLAVGLFVFGLIILVSLRNREAEQRLLRPVDGLQAFLVVLAAVLIPLIIVALAITPAVPPATSLILYLLLAAAAMTVIFVWDVFRRGWRWLWLDWLALSLLAAALLIVFNIPADTTRPYQETPIVGDILQTMDEWRDVPGVGRIGSLLEADRGTGRVRVLIWEGTLELVTPHSPLFFPDGGQDAYNFLRPLIGYGPESMYVTYNRFYPPQLATVEARNASPDRAHNETFDALAITGLLGFLVWQLLYLSVFYYGFRWLGVVRSAAERNLFIIFWIGGAVLAGVGFSLARGPAYLGVAIPFGSIGGLVFYLTYHALFATVSKETTGTNPFAAHRLLLAALVGAMIAYYVEIHFGIAIAATRLHFFVYLALMLLIGYRLPQLKDEPEVEVVPARKGRRRKVVRSVAAAQPGWGSNALIMALMLGLVIAVLGYNYMNYSQPPGVTIQTLQDVPTAGDIFQQSLFVNPVNNFIDSPFIYLLVMMTWALGGLLILSEMAKEGQIKPPQLEEKINRSKQQTAAALFALLIVAGPIARLIVADPAEAGLSRLIGGALLLIWSVLCLFAMARLLLAKPGGANDSLLRRQPQLTGAAVAMIGLVLAVPVMVAGGAAFLYGVAMAIVCGAILYYLWDDNWRQLLMPAALVGLVSIALGFTYAYFQAAQIRAAIIGPQNLPATITPMERTVLAAELGAAALTLFYIFVIAFLFTASLVLAYPLWQRVRANGRLEAVVALCLLLPLSFYLINYTNLRVIQADIIYKRGDPFDRQAMRSGNPAEWDVAIAIYEKAIELAPTEDFYYLWLGRAYLEKAAVVDSQAERQALLETANARLEEAQRLNPLNTDHTANLARLNSRWADDSSGAERDLRIATAAAHYQDALTLSPQNSVIRNEYARLIFVMEQDCDRALEVFQESVEIDPYFSQTYFIQAEVALSCAAQAPAEEQERYYAIAVESLDEGLSRSPRDPRRWLAAAELHLQRMNDSEAALAAYDEARRRANNQLPAWQIDITMAQQFLAAGDREQARLLAERALEEAPSEMAGQIEAFLTQLADEE